MLSVTVITGGDFDAHTPVSTMPGGTFRAEFENCMTGTVIGDVEKQGEIAIQRLAADYASFCEAGTVVS